MVGFFLYAYLVDHRFFVVIAVCALFCTIYLIWPIRYRCMQLKATYELQLEDVREKNNLLSAEIQHEQLAINSFRDKIINTSKLKDLTEKLSMCFSLEDTSKTLSSEVSKLFGSKETTIILYLFHSETGELGISSSKKGEMQINIKAKKGDLFDEWLVKTMQPFLVTDIKRDFRFDIDRLEAESERRIRSLISVPLIVESKALGILRLDSAFENYFDTEDLRFLKTIGDLGALAIENAQLYERIEKLAIRDGLTGLYMKRYLNERMTAEVSRHLRNKKTLSFLMLDIDYFKKYNDTYGHTAGDIVLRGIGELLGVSFIEAGDIVCRYGGEEFCVLLTDCTKSVAKKKAEDFRQSVESAEFILRRKKTHVTVSIGIASLPKDGQTPEQIIQNHRISRFQGLSEGSVCVLCV